MDHEHHNHSENHSGHEAHKPAIVKKMSHAHHKRDPTKADPHLKHSDMHNTAYDQHAGHHIEGFLKRFWICLILTIPVLLLSHMIQQWFRFEIRFAGDSYVLLALGTFIYVYGGYPFLVGMIRELRYKNIGMMTLGALAISVAYVYSVAVIFGLQGMDFFWELATLVDIMLLGHWLEMRAQMSASRALQSLVALLPSVVHIERNGTVVDVDVDELKAGDTILIKPGEKLPADGMVTEGSSYVNESMLTGESVPVQKLKDAKVIAGSINGDGSLRIQVTGAGKDSYLNKVINLVQSAQSAKSTTQNLANKVAKWITVIYITIGIVVQMISFAKATYRKMKQNLARQ